VAASHDLLVRDSQVLRLTLANRPSGPALDYSSHPPTLQGDDPATAFESSFVVLGRHFSIKTPPDRLPLPGQQAFIPALTGAALDAGSVAEIYATATQRSRPDYIAVIKIVENYPDNSMSVDYVTYLRSCTVTP
jgi:hypothetical protein